MTTACCSCCALQKYLPYCMTTTDQQGYICSQNVAAMAAFGCHVPSATTRADGTDQGHNFLEMLFHGHPVRPICNV